MAFKARVLRYLRIAAILPAALASTAASAQGATQDGHQQFASLGQCQLESGKVIEDCRIGYRTYGHLNPAGDNAVLVPTWLYGTTGDLASLFGDGSPSQQNSGQQIIDTSRWFGIAIDALADGVSSSPSNSARQHGTAFPALTLNDSVRAEYRVITEVLHLKHLHAVTGLSMGGEQTFIWATLYPNFFDLAAPVLGTPRLTSYDLVVKQIMVESIEADPAYTHGSYTTEPPLKLANLFGALVVTTPEYRNQATPRGQLASYINATEASRSIDANDRMWQLKAIMQQDVVGKRTIAEAARATPVKFLVIVSQQDRLVNPQPALDWAAATGAPTYISPGACAHLIMLCDAQSVSSRIRAFLNSK